MTPDFNAKRKTSEDGNVPAPPQHCKARRGGDSRAARRATLSGAATGPEPSKVTEKEEKNEGGKNWR